MNFLTNLALATLLAVLPLSAPSIEPVPFATNYELLQAAAVTVVTKSGSGSGVIVLGTNGVAFCWTAAHVIGDEKSDVVLVKQVVVGGRTVGRFSVDAEVISVNSTQDLAVLRPRSVAFFKTGARFESAIFIPKIGDRILHVGSFLGAPGAESFSSGEVSYVGRVREGLLIDQVSNPCFPGSSGGPVFSAEGRVIGLIVSGFDATFSFMVPIRRMAAWAADEKHPEWLGNFP